LPCQPSQARPQSINLPAFCRVQGVIAPTQDSHIEFEVWLPATGWNGKYQGIGNGAFAGAIEYGGDLGGLTSALRAGYAVAGGAAVSENGSSVNLDPTNVGYRP
jgi:hypothetical protein